MAITLDPVHAAAQELQNRKPLCRISSLENADPIPFDGELLSTSMVNEQHPDAKMHSTGRLFVAFAVGSGSSYVIRFGYTDTARTFFTYVDLAVAASRVVGEVSVCEMADGYVGLIWEESYGGTRSIKYRKITVTGVDPTPAVTGTIFTQATSAFFTGPAVACLADDSYIMVYGIQDGDSHYHLYRRTSANLVTWSAAAEIDLSGLADANRKANPYLIEPAAGTLWLLFDYVNSIGPSDEELTNVYQVTSTDKLATASGETALTAYASYDEVAAHPTMAQISASELYLVFDRVLASLKMDTDTTGWCGANAHISNMHIDTAAQKLYVVASNMGGGTKTLSCVVKIDLASWTIDDCWSTSTVPSFPSYFASGGGAIWGDSCKGAGAYVPVGNTAGLISVLNATTDTITSYAFYDFTAYGVAQNVTWTPPTSGGYSLVKAQVDAATDRLYVLLMDSYIWHQGIIVGYFDLTAAGPTYTFTPILTDTTWSDYDLETGLSSDSGCFEVLPADDLVVVSLVGSSGVVPHNGQMRIYSLSTGGLWKTYNVTSNPTFPKFGLNRGVYNGGVIAGTFEYTALYGQADYRGLCLIDTATDVITYQRPPWASVNDYGLRDITLTDDGEYIIAAYGYGVTLLSGSAWTLYSNDTLPGLTPSGEEYFQNPVVYNPATQMIIAGHFSNGGVWQGLVMFSRSGYIKQVTYRIGTLSGTWSWATAAPLVIGYTDYEAVPAVDPDDGSLYAFWTNQNGTELSIKWDKALPAFDLSSYLVRGESVERSSTNDPSTGNWNAGLSFSVTHGHLFDPSNSASLLRTYLSKGRRLQQQFGDKVAGVDYWEPARIFTVSDDGELDYERGEYPVMRVEAETPRRRWEQMQIVNSGYYSTTPELIIADLLEDYAGILPASISLGAWPNSATVEYQFVDVMLSDAVDMIAAHFGYAIRDGETGIIEAVKITDAAAVDRTYSDNTKLLRATPRNRFSSFVNRWIVESEEKTFTELLMAEELAAEFNASHRWNTGSKAYRINYTQGRKIYRNPRLDVVQSVEALAFSLAGGCSESLIDNSHDETDQALWDTYCEIDVDSPDLTPAFISALAGLVSSYWVPDLLNLSTETTQRVGSYITAFWIVVCLNILAATGNFQYRIYGRPVIKVRRKISGNADDTDMQVKMAQVISEQPFQDPLCASPAECQAVADYRKMVGMGERRRWSAEMVADLRVEDGDTLSVVHPASGDGVTVFLTDLKMVYVMPEGNSDSGSFTMQFEGWRR